MILINCPERFLFEYADYVGQFLLYRMCRKRFLVFSILTSIQLLAVIWFLEYQNYMKGTDFKGKDVKFFTFFSLPNFEFLRTNNKEKVLRNWTLCRENLLSEGEDATISKPHQDFLLLLRKLVLFSIREVNIRIKEEDGNCPKWWVNPLSVQTVTELFVSHGVLQYDLTLEAQPGRVPFGIKVLLVEYRQRKPNTRLVLVNSSRLDRPPTECGEVPENLRHVCLCPQEWLMAANKTEAIRKEWDKTDPELQTWPPDSPMFVSDYIRLAERSLYLKSPSNNIEFCNPTVKMIVFISSAPSHSLERNTIRTTFGNTNQLQPLGVRLLFMLGKLSNMTLQLEIDEEGQKYEDILQADFADSYHNLSLSHVSMYNWVARRCQYGAMPKWVLKADDDFFLNIPLAIRIAEANPETQFIGFHFCGTKPVRDVAYIGKYYVPRYIYLPDWYAGYLSGVAYMVQTDSFKPILEAVRTTPIIHMEDIYITGLLTKEAGIRPMHSKLFSYGRDPDPCNIKLMVNSCVYNASDMAFQWEQFKKPVEPGVNCHVQDSFLKVDQLSSSINRACFFE